MRLLRRETTIPIPEVYVFNASLTNEINCPFILMESVDGIQLHKGWFSEKASKASLETFRARALQDLAGTMMQLGGFGYEQGGTLLFDTKGNVAGIGPVATIDDSVNFSTSTICDLDEPPIREVGPFLDSKTYIFDQLMKKQDPTSRWDLGILRLLRVFVNWIPFDQWKRDPDFVLSHPDLNHQNILVSEEGALRGLIDWDGVAAVPRCIGCEAYPSWLTRDWDPTMYNFNCEIGELVIPDGCPENTPEELEFYREMYATFIDARLSKEVAEPKTSETGSIVKSNPESYDNVTRNSLLMDSLVIAADEPICAPGILEHIFDEITRLTAASWRVATAIAEPKDSSVEGKREYSDDIKYYDQSKEDNVKLGPSLTEPMSRKSNEDRAKGETVKDEWEENRQRRRHELDSLQPESSESVGGAEAYDLDLLNFRVKPDSNLSAEQSSIFSPLNTETISQLLDRSCHHSPVTQSIGASVGEELVQNERGALTGVDETGLDYDASIFQFSDTIYAFADGTVDSRMLQRLKEGFEALLF